MAKIKQTPVQYDYKTRKEGPPSVPKKQTTLKPQKVSKLVPKKDEHGNEKTVRVTLVPAAKKPKLSEKEQDARTMKYMEMFGSLNKYVRMNVKFEKPLVEKVKNQVLTEWKNNGMKGDAESLFKKIRKGVMDELEKDFKERYKQRPEYVEEVFDNVWKNDVNFLNLLNDDHNREPWHVMRHLYHGRVKHRTEEKNKKQTENEQEEGYESDPIKFATNLNRRIQETVAQEDDFDNAIQKGATHVKAWIANGKVDSLNDVWMKLKLQLLNSKYAKIIGQLKGNEAEYSKSDVDTAFENLSFEQIFGNLHLQSEDVIFEKINQLKAMKAIQATEKTKGRPPGSKNKPKQTGPVTRDATPEEVALALGTSGVVTQAPQITLEPETVEAIVKTATDATLKVLMETSKKDDDETETDGEETDTDDDYEETVIKTKKERALDKVKAFVNKLPSTHENKNVSNKSNKKKDKPVKMARGAKKKGGSVFTYKNGKKVMKAAHKKKLKATQQAYKNLTAEEKLERRKANPKLAPLIGDRDWTYKKHRKVRKVLNPTTNEFEMLDKAVTVQGPQMPKMGIRKWRKEHMSEAGKEALAAGRKRRYYHGRRRRQGKSAKIEYEGDPVDIVLAKPMKKGYHKKGFDGTKMRKTKFNKVKRNIDPARRQALSDALKAKWADHKAAGNTGRLQWT